MVVAPCSMRTLAAIAHGLTDNLLTRAADVMLKERRRLILLARETPLHLVHLRNMTTVTEMGAIVCPPVPAFYQKPQTVEDIVQHSLARVLDLLGLEQTLAAPWMGLHMTNYSRSTPVKCCWRLMKPLGITARLLATDIDVPPAASVNWFTANAPSPRIPLCG